MKMSSMRLTPAKSNDKNQPPKNLRFDELHHQRDVRVFGYQQKNLPTLDRERTADRSWQQETNSYARLTDQGVFAKERLKEES